MVRVQETNKGQMFITIPHVIANAMGLRKRDQVLFRWNGTSWEIRRD